MPSLADIYGTSSAPRRITPLRGGTSGGGSGPSLADIYNRSTSVPRKALTSGHNYAVAKRTPKGQPKHHRSILGQLKDAAYGIPGGMIHLGHSAIQTVGGLATDYGHRVASDVRHHHLGAAALDVTALPTAIRSQQAGIRALTNPSSLSPADRAFNPLEAELGASMNRTGMDIRHPTHFAQANREGNLVGKLLEDAGNIAIVGGPLAKGLGAVGTAADAAGLTRTAGALEAASTVTGRIAHLGGATADLPVSLPRAGIRAASEHLSPLVESFGPGKYLAEKNPLLFTAEGRTVRREALRGGGDPTIGLERSSRDKASVPREYKRALDKAELTPDEEAAALALYRGQAHNLARLQDQTHLATPDLLDATQPRKLAEHHLSPEAGQLAIDLARGTADPAVAGRIDQALGAVERQSAIDSGRALAGYGRKGNRPLSQEQITGNDVLQGALPTIAADKGIPVHQLTPAHLADITDPTAYPSRWRPRMVENQRVRGALIDHELEQLRPAIAQRIQAQAGQVPIPPKALADMVEQVVHSPQILDPIRTRIDAAHPDLIATPKQMAAAGVETRYLPSGESSLVHPRTTRLRRTMDNEGAALTGDVKQGNEFARQGTGLEPHSLRTLADLQMRDRGQAVTNETMRSIIGEHAEPVLKTTAAGTGAMRGVIEPHDYAQIVNDAKVRATSEFPNPRGHEQEIGYRTRALAGEEIRTRMADAGFEPWPAEGDLAAVIPPSQIDARTPFLPAGLRQRLVPYWTPKPPPMILEALGKLNAKFKTAVLAPSIRWQIGDAVSNMLMAGVAGWVDPITMTRRMRQVATLGKDEIGARLLDQGIPEHGLFYDETAWQRGLEPGGGERRNLPLLGTHRPIKALTGMSFHVNEVVNRYQRSAFYLEQLDRRLKAQGIDLMDAAKRIDDPQIQRSIAEAADQTSFILGDMANMSPIERRYVKQVFPFWPWIRHVYHLVGRLAVDHPARLVVTLRIGDLVAQDGELPPSAQGSVRGPGGYWPTAFMNPLSDAGGLPGLGVEGTLRASSPWLKLGAAALGGQDWNRAGMPISTGVTGTGRKDWYGRDTVNPLIFNPAGLAYQTAKIAPLTREAMNVALGNHPRYATGKVITTRGGKPIDTTPRWVSPLALFGVPRPTSVSDVTAQQATRRRRLKANKAKGG